MKPKWIVCIAVFGLCCMGAEAGTLLHEDFEDPAYQVGEPPVPPWDDYYVGWDGSPEYTRGQADVLGVRIRIDDSGISGKSCHFFDTNANVASGIRRPLVSPASAVVLEYYMCTANDSYEGAFVHLHGDAGADYQVAFSNGAYDGMAGYIGVHGTTEGWIKPDLLAYSENTWYYVRRELDCLADTGLFYVEEVGNPSNNASYAIGRNPYCPSNQVEGIGVWTSTSQGADCYIDNITIVPLPGPGLLGIAGLGLLAWFKRRDSRIT